MVGGSYAGRRSEAPVLEAPYSTGIMFVDVQSCFWVSERNLQRAEGPGIECFSNPKNPSVWTVKVSSAIE